MAVSMDIRQTLIAAMAHSSEPLVLSDPNLPDNPLIAANDAFLRLTQYAREEIIGRNCRFLQGPDTDPATAHRIGRRMSEGGGCIEWVVNYRKDGTMFWNLLFISPVHDHDGKIVAFLGNQLNITNGVPSWVGDLRRGQAVMSDVVLAEFQTVLEQIRHEMQDQPEVEADPVTELKLKLLARRLSVLATRLEPPVDKAQIG